MENLTVEEIQEIYKLLNLKLIKRNVSKNILMVNLVDKLNSKLILKIINKIKNKFDVKLITKFNNINKARVDMTIPCTTKRVSKYSRLYIPYYIVKYNNLSLNDLETFDKGVCVGINYEEYENLMNTELKELDELEKYLISNIGSDNIVSSIIVIIKKNGNSSSSNLRIQKNKLEKIINENNWTSIEKINNKKRNEVNNGNDKWTGHYYYCINGGHQESFQSWSKDEPQIFTSYKNFMASNKIIIDNKACLMYMLLFIHDINENIDIENNIINYYKIIFELYLKNTYYMNDSCYNLITKLNVIYNNELISPILYRKINYEDLLINDKINISHNEATCKNKIYFCKNNNKILSDFRPGNIFWDFKIANMRQQDDTIEEYWNSIMESVKLRNEIINS